ncbi:MAG: hypothetical protein ACYCYO_03820 [Bacilli bacterium]
MARRTPGVNGNESGVEAVFRRGKERLASKKRRWGVIALAVLAGFLLAAAIPVLAHTIANGHTGQTVNAGTGAVVSSQGTSAQGGPATPMNWLGNIIVGFLMSLFDGFSFLFMSAGFTVQHVIESSMMSNGAAPFGSGNWFDVVPFGRNKTVMLPFMSVFFSLGLAWLLISLYIGAARIASGPNGRQRNILKSELGFFVFAALLMMAGPSFAVAVTQLCYDFALYFLKLGGSTVLSGALFHMGTSPITNLFDSIVQFIQVIMTVVLYVMYQFRELFLDAWIMLFPLAMAMAANDKTRGIAKLWWTEWIYQMLVPVGQAMVFGFATAIVNPNSAQGLGIAEIFTSLVGVIGFIASAVYVRKMVEVVGGAFNAQVMGHTAGGAAAVAAGFVAGDLAGGAAVGAMGKMHGAVGKTAFRAVDRQFAGSARQAVTKSPETAGGQIARGATLDDVMANHVMAARGGDPLQDGQGAGVEGGQKLGGFGGSGGGRSGGGSSRLSHHHPFFSSHTAGAMGNIAAGAKTEFGASNMALAMKTNRQAFANEGGRMGRIGDLGAAAVGAVAGTRLGQAIPGMEGAGQAAESYKADRQASQARLNEVRSQLLGSLHANAAVSRMANINEQEFTPPKEAGQDGTFSGPTPAMEAYNAHRSGFVEALAKENGIHVIYNPKASMAGAETAAQATEASWQQGGHAQNQAQWTPATQAAYRQAHAAYHPAARDMLARQQVLDNRVAMAPPDADPRKQQLFRARNFMNDARAGILRLPLTQTNPGGVKPAPPTPWKIPPEKEAEQEQHLVR